MSRVVNFFRGKIGIFLAFLLIFQVASIGTKAENHGLAYPLQETAKSLANYVMLKAENDRGYKWSIRTNRNTLSNAALQNGAAGVGFFLIALYSVTGNSTYLEYAKGAASWIMANAESRDGGLTWPQYDLEGGWYLTPDKSVSGIAKFLLEMYKVSLDKNFLANAQKATQWIINTGIKCQGDQCYVEYNPYHQAAFGVYSYPQRDVGTLLLELYNITGNQIYLSYALKIGNWILATSNCYRSYCKWYDDRGYGNIYTVEGVAVLADYLYDLYTSTKIEKYREVADKMVNWIESQGIKTADTIKFPSHDGKFRSIVWGDWDRLLSIRTVGEIFVKSYEVTGNRSRLTIAKMFENWLENISTAASRGAKAVPYIEGENGFSPWVNAIIIKYVIKLYQKEKEQKYLDFVLSLLNYINYFIKERMSELDPTFYRGASGIGYYLTLAIGEMKEEAGMISSVPKNPPTLSLFEPQINGLEVLINGVASPGHKDAKITRIHWDWGDGFSEDHWFPASHTYSMPGTYVVTVTSYQSDGLTATKTLTVKVEAGNNPPVADFSYIPLNPLAGDSVSFADQSYDPDGNVVFWRWDFGDGTTSYERNPRHVFSSPGTYTVTLTVKDDRGAEKSISRAIYVGKREGAVNSRIVELAAFILVVVVVVTILALSRGRGGRGVAAERPPAETAAVQVSPDALKAELERYEGYLRRLEELRAGGKVSEQVYQSLKREYEAKVEELRRALEKAGAS